MKRGSMLRNGPKADTAPSRSALLNPQRQPAFGRLAPGRKSGDSVDCRERLSVNGGFLQRSAVNQRPVPAVPPIVSDVLRSPGLPLDFASRSFFEPRFGHDFSQVRVHNDARAAESAGAVNAHAYTVGHDIVFGAGQYSLGTKGSRRLLGHELAHVVQQKNRVPAALSMNIPSDPLELEADHAARSVDEASAAPSIHVAGVGLMREPATQPAGTKRGPEKEDANVKELKEKVKKLVAKNFQGDYEKAFRHYDANQSGSVDKEEITKLLKDADVGNWATRGSWVDGILSKMDTNKDGKIDWKEFQDGIKG